MKKESELRKVLEIAIPSTIAWVGHIGYNIVDNIMTGKILGTSALAVSGIAGSIYFMFLIFGAGSTGILTALISEKVATKEHEKTIFVFQNGLIFCIILGALLSILLFFTSGHIVDLVNKQEALTLEIKQFITILSYGPFFVTIFFAFERLTEGTNRAKLSMYTVFICNIINVILNYIFLKHLAMGVTGVATATFFTNIFETLIIILLVKMDKVTGAFLKFKIKYISIKQILYTTKFGIPGGVFGFIETACFGIAGFIAGLVSINDVAAHQLILWSINFVLTPVFGFSVAIAARIAYNVALNKKDVSFKMGLIGLASTAFYMVACMILFNVLKYPILGFMLKTGEEDLITIALVVSTLLILIIVELFDGVQIMALAILRGYKDTQIPVLFAFISYFMLCLPSAYYFGYIKNMGVYGIWMGIGIGLFFQASSLTLRFIYKFKLPTLS